MEARERVLRDALAAGAPPGDRLEAGGTDAEAYADAVATYLGLRVSRTADYRQLARARGRVRREDRSRNLFARQAIPMAWDFAEANPFADSAGSYAGD